MSVPSLSFQISQDESALMFIAVSFTGQTLIFGAYLAFFPLAIRVLLRKRLQDVMSKIMLGLMILAFALCTAYWVVSATNLYTAIRTVVEHLPKDVDAGVMPYMELCSAIVMLNFVFCDGVVLRRAWAICSDFKKAKVALSVGVLMFVLTAVSTFVTIAIEAVVVSREFQGLPALESAKKALEVSELAAVILTLITNVCATGCVAWRAWHFRSSAKALKGAVRTDREGPTVETVLKLMVESGAAYCLSTVLLILAVTIHVASGSNVDGIYAPIHIQIAGLYPTIVLVLANQTRTKRPSSIPVSSFTNPSFGQTRGAIQFAHDEQSSSASKTPLFSP